ncbi:DNA-directed RNA polymerase sigma-E/Sigma-24/FecI [Sphingomonas sp. LH128]|nr:DNA-directed RNA polymerase sigma-E/Sigma-24/FecI [Sphingomonas sp. LH128]
MYEEHLGKLVLYARQVSGEARGAEDIVHDAWLLMERKAENAIIHEPVGYVRRVIRNLIFERNRRRRETSLAPEDMPDIVDERPSVEAQIMGREAMQLVLDAIEAMPDRQKIAIRLYHFEGLRLKDVAAQLGLSLSYTQNLIAQGMEICDRQRRLGL